MIFNLIERNEIGKLIESTSCSWPLGLETQLELQSKCLLNYVEVRDAVIFQTKLGFDGVTSHYIEIIIFDILVLHRHHHAPLSDRVYSWRNNWQPQHPNLPLRALNMKCSGWAIECWSLLEAYGRKPEHIRSADESNQPVRRRPTRDMPVQ